MSTVLLRGNPVHTNGSLPTLHAKAPHFTLVKNDLSTTSLSDFAGQNLILNIFPSIDTSVCATSVRKFNEKAAGLENTKVLCISRDLPFAQTRFCGAEGIENVITLSDFKDGSFGREYGIEMTDGSFAGLHARAIVVIGPDGMVKYEELVPNISDEPNYEAALAAVK